MHDYVHVHSRRDFFTKVFGGILAGASLLENAFLRATWARAQSHGASTKLFSIEKVSDGVYAALARPQVMPNCNAAIFEHSSDLVVVDAHSTPSAAASLIAQIKKEVTAKPVRYLVNSHFHLDHTQGNSAYKASGAKVDIVASDTTKELMAQLGRDRCKESVEEVLGMIDGLEARRSKAATAADQNLLDDQIWQLKAYRAEMANYSPDLPTITFAKSYVIKDRAGDLHLEFHGRAHTAGDIVIFSPQKRVLAAGDIICGLLPNITDGYPKAWPATINSMGRLSFDRLIAGHGPVQDSRERIIQMRDYIEELTERVEEGRNAGKSLAEIQKTLTVASVKTLQADGYSTYLQENMQKFAVYIGRRTPMEDRLSRNIEGVYNNLDRV